MIIAKEELVFFVSAILSVMERNNVESFSPADDSLHYEDNSPWRDFMRIVYPTYRPFFEEKDLATEFCELLVELLYYEDKEKSLNAIKNKKPAIFSWKKKAAVKQLRELNSLKETLDEKITDYDIRVRLMYSEYKTCMISFYKDKSVIDLLKNGE